MGNEQEVPDLIETWIEEANVKIDCDKITIKDLAIVKLKNEAPILLQLVKQYGRLVKVHAEYTGQDNLSGYIQWELWYKRELLYGCDIVVVFHSQTNHEIKFNGSSYIQHEFSIKRAVIDSAAKSQAH